MYCQIIKWIRRSPSYTNDKDVRSGKFVRPERWIVIEKEIPQSRGFV